jgi:S-adenosylmethionine hydrolase
MQIITITSDWNEDDYYVGALKGRLLSGCPEARLVDISHRIKPFNTAQAAFIVRNSFGNFPKGSVHLVAVNTEARHDCSLLAASLEGQYMLCADNGFLGLLGDVAVEEVVSLRQKGAEEVPSFIAWSVFADAACKLARGARLEELGSPCTDYDRQVPMRPAMEGNAFTGSVIHLDSYRNAITNISREHVEQFGKGRPFRIYLSSKHYVLNKIMRDYAETEKGEFLAIWNSLGLLEIAIREGKAADLLNLRLGSSIKIEFTEN